MKKNDIIIIALFVIIAVISGVWFMFSSNSKSQTKYVEIYVDNVLYKKIELTSNMKEQTFTVNTKYGWNIVHIANGKVNVKDADCPDKICVKSGYIDKPGQSIVCLPHKMVVEIKGQSKDAVDGVVF